jgi:hypothetical protein
MLTQGKQVATIAGGQHLDSRVDRTGKAQVVVGVAADRLGWTRGGGDLHRRDIDEQLLDRVPSVASSRIRLGGPAAMNAETRTGDRPSRM